MKLQLSTRRKTIAMRRNMIFVRRNMTAEGLGTDHDRVLDSKLASTNKGHLPGWLGSVPVPGQSPKR